MATSARFPENPVSTILTLQGACFTHGIDWNHVTTSETSVIDFDHGCATVGVFFNPTVHKLRIFSQIRMKFSNIFTPYSE